MPFSVKSNSNLPECLQARKTKYSKKARKDHVEKEREIKKKDKAKSYSKGKKLVQRRNTAKKRQKIFDSDSSSMFDDNEVLTIDTDDSDYVTMNDYYIAKCLQEQEENENFEPTDTSFGFHEIEYFTENQGNILAINNKFPTVKFVRKVKESKCEEGTVFTYPLVDDICTMQNLNDVITILTKPKITRRGRIIFRVDFNNFNIQ
ncbi:hypothetical protein ACJJTC_011538 [Scirpophaga incertulas]